MAAYMDIKLYISLFYFIATLAFIQGQYTYRYVGCYKDFWWYGRALSGHEYEGDKNTIEYCVNLCWKKNFKYAGLQFSSECFCGNSGYDKYGEIYEGGCSHFCIGDNNQFCGGRNQNSVYVISEATTTKVETTKTVSTTTKVTTTFLTTQPPSNQTATATTTATETGAKGRNDEEMRSGTYIGIAVGAVCACVIILLVALLVLRRKKNNEALTQGMPGSAHQAAANIYEAAPSNATPHVHYTVSNGDVYTVVHTPDRTNQTPAANSEYETNFLQGNEHTYTTIYTTTSEQAAADNGDNELVYSLAGPINDN